MNFKAVWCIGTISTGLIAISASAQNSSANTQVPPPGTVPAQNLTNPAAVSGNEQPGLITPSQPAASTPDIQPAGANPAVTGTTAPIGSSAPTNFGPVPITPGTTATVPPTAPPTPTVTPPAVSTTPSTVLNTTPQYLQKDQAITPEDQAMLTQMRQAVFPQGTSEAWMNSVHFILKDGAVRLVGTVPTAQDRQRIEGVVRQIPGVTRVYDAMAVNPSAAVASSGAPATNSASGITPAPVPSPTGYPATNANGSATPNPAATNSIRETAPGQQPK